MAVVGVARLNKSRGVNNGFMGVVGVCRGGISEKVGNGVVD
jgi:hypothetical protein